MTRYVLAGGGTAGHVNPLLAVADRLRSTEPDAHLVVVGTAEGLESRLVPARGYPLEIITKVPFPRRVNASAFSFASRLHRARSEAIAILRNERADVVVGFGGYVSTPVYLAARALRIPIVIHEANARPGLANRLAASWTTWVGVTFPNTPLPHARVVGMPLRAEIESLATTPRVRASTRTRALAEFGLNADRPVLLVTGGSLGARTLNATVAEVLPELLDGGWQVLHLVGGGSELPAATAGYCPRAYLDDMELALAVADCAVSRAGSSTVSELGALQIPTVYIPYPIGNGEQRLNAQSAVVAGAALLVDDAAFSAEWVRHTLLPLLADGDRLAQMKAAAGQVAISDGTAQTVRLIHESLA